MGTTRKGSKGVASSYGEAAAATQPLQAAIDKAGHNWTAAATPISQLSLEDRKARLGLSVTEEEVAAFAAAVKASSKLTALRAISAPAAVDWRNNGGNWTTSVKDQKNCGACVAFSSIATIESRVKIACKDASLEPDYSEAFLFFCGCGNCCDTGWNFAPALNYCKDTGVVANADFPYTPTNQPCKSGVTPQFKITAWSSVMPMDERKHIIATKGPVVAGMAVFNDFFSYSSGVYKHTTGALVGYHAVSVVGYDDAQQCWIVKNSWNTTWGEGGYFRIAYGESIDKDFPFFDVDVPCPDKTEDDTCTRYLPVLRRVLEMARTNAMLRQCLRYYVCGRPPRRTCTAPIMRVVTAVLQILRACPQYRQPFCRALG